MSRSEVLTSLIVKECSKDTPDRKRIINSMIQEEGKLWWWKHRVREFRKRLRTIWMFWASDSTFRRMTRKVGWQPKTQLPIVHLHWVHRVSQGESTMIEDSCQWSGSNLGSSSIATKRRTVTKAAQLLARNAIMPLEPWSNGKMSKLLFTDKTEVCSTLKS